MRLLNLSFPRTIALNLSIVVAMVAASCLLPSPKSMAADILATAASGTPYGVAVVELPLTVPVAGEALPALVLSDPKNRILYTMHSDVRQTVTNRPQNQPLPQIGRGRLLNRVGNLIRDLSDPKKDVQQTVSRRAFFLFRGSDPMDVTVSDAGGQVGTYRIVPVSNPTARVDLMNQWWNAYTSGAKSQMDAAGYPPLIETYLIAMLSGRTGMPLPAWYNEQTPDADPLIETLKLLGGSADQTTAIFRAAAAGSSLPEGVANLPLPASPTWAPDFQRQGLENVETEPLASRVPPECFYLRYGSFENFLWFQDLSAEYGGDVSAMASVKGLSDDGMKRIESQLQVKTTEMSRLMGPSVIEDQAIIGRDLFMADGASIGVLIKAKNAFLLRTSLNGERAGVAKNNDSVALTNLKIDGHDVTFLHSADNSIRSFLVEDDGYILVTNSRSIAKRFIEVGKTKASLAATPEFRLARELMPLTRNDTLFIYVAPAMLRGLIEPDYLIEHRRRVAAKSEINLVHMARLAAKAEGNPLRGIDELKQAGYLPATFGRTPDGSGVFTMGDRILDARRGVRGSFLPIADSPVESVTSAEAGWYSRIAAEYSTRFQTVSPIMVGIQRQTLAGPNEGVATADGVAPGPAIERISIHAEAAPWDPSQYGWYSQQLGPPTNVAIQFAPDDIIAVQAHVASDQLGTPTHLFAAIKDTIPPNPKDVSGLLGTFFAVRGVPGYLGAWPQPGALDRLPLGLGRGQPVGPGMSRLLGGIYRYTGGGFSVLSFDPDLLGASLPEMAAVEVADSAQLRVHVGNLKGSQLEGWVNNQLYGLASKPSAAGANFLNQLSGQLKVDPEEALEITERILGGNLQCPLGGEYRYSDQASRWVSTAWQGMTSPPSQSPPRYTAPVMQWFRGGSTNVTQYPDRIVADSVIDVLRTP